MRSLTAILTVLCACLLLPLGTWGATTPAPSVTKLDVVNTITAGDSPTFNVITDRSATKVIIRFTGAGADVQMKGSGTKWSLTQRINQPGKCSFTAIAYNQSNKNGGVKSDSIQVNPKVVPLNVNQFDTNLKAGNTVNVIVGGGKSPYQVTATPSSAVSIHQSNNSFSVTAKEAGKTVNLEIRDSSNNKLNRSIVIAKADPPKDTAKPTVSSFSLNAATIEAGKSVTISYSVKDNGGAGLKQVELWRSTNNKDFVELTDKRKSLSGDGPTSGSFSDTPQTAGTYYYGLHVVDHAGNWSSEGGAKKVQVTKQNAAKVTIKKVTGNSSITGQPSNCNPCKSNITDGFLAVDYYPDVNISMTIEGSGFGNNKGKVIFSDSTISVSSMTWSDSKITIIPKTNSFDYTYNNKVTITVLSTDGGDASHDLKVAGTIRTRPWGQCTWEVARTRLINGLLEPRKAAYSTTGNIDGNYVPTQWDAINFGGRHVGIIESVPQITTEQLPTKNRPKEKGSVVTYSFKVRDRNAGWDEAVASTPVTFSVKVDAGKKYVEHNFKRIADAVGYYR